MRLIITGFDSSLSRSERWSRIRDLWHPTLNETVCCPDSVRMTHKQPLFVWKCPNNPDHVFIRKAHGTWSNTRDTPAPIAHLLENLLQNQVFHKPQCQIHFERLAKVCCFGEFIQHNPLPDYPFIITTI